MKQNLVIKGRNKDESENCYLVYGVEIAKTSNQIVDLKSIQLRGRFFGRSGPNREWVSHTE